MNTKKTLPTILVGSLMAFSVAVVSHAEISVSTDSNTTATVSAPTASTTARAATTASVRTKKSDADKLAVIIKRSDDAITKRIDDLNALNTRVQGLKNVSDTEKQSISASVQANISGLTSLKAKIDADTDASTAMTDAKSITGSYRIYMLVVPQGHIAAAADRVATIVNMMTSLQVKVQARLDAEKAAGKDVSVAQGQMAVLTAAVADAGAKGQSAQGSVANLKPDQGDKTVQASNTAALKSARADIKTATGDLETARKTLKSIVGSLK